MKKNNRNGRGEAQRSGTLVSANKVQRKRKPVTANASPLQTAIVRDLMKPIYMFGQHDAPETFVTQLDVALQKLDAGETFYLRAGDKVYHIATTFYRSMGMTMEPVKERMRTICEAQC
jgi:hypothetical protein